jgi:cupin superfamily protein
VVERFLHVGVARHRTDDTMSTSRQSLPHPVGVAEVLAPLTTASFTAGTMGRGPLLIAGWPGKFERLLSWDRLNRLLAEQRLGPPRLRMERAGASAADLNIMVPVPRPMPPPVERVSPLLLYQRLREGATLIVNGVEEVSQELAWLADDVAAIFAGRPQINLYASFGHAPGFGLHWDGRDVLVLQVRGRKHWEVRPPSVEAPLYVTPQDRATMPADVVWEGVLCAGDVLYVPRGWWHEAVSLDEPSLHLTLGYDPITGVDYVGWLLQRVRDDVRFRTEIPRFGGLEAIADYQAEIAAALAEHLAAAPATAYLRARRVAAADRPRFALPDAVVSRRGPLPPATLLRRCAPLVLELVDDGVLAVEGNGQQITLPGDAHQAVSQLGTTLCISVGELRRAWPDAGALDEALQELLRAGVIEIVTRDPSDPLR